MPKKHATELGTSIVLRPHHLLCVQGFRGLGYSPQFVATMQRVVHTLQDNAVLVGVEVRADVICQSCPYLTDSHICSRGTPADRDQAVLSVLKVRPEVEKPWGEWLNLIAICLNPECFRTLCSDCEWYQLGYCMEEIKRLQQNSIARE